MTQRTRFLGRTEDASLPAGLPAGAGLDGVRPTTHARKIGTLRRRIAENSST